jgi:hypothetical protein
VAFCSPKTDIKTTTDLTISIWPSIGRFQLGQDQINIFSKSRRLQSSPSVRRPRGCGRCWLLNHREAKDTRKFWPQARSVRQRGANRWIQEYR